MCRRVAKKVIVVISFLLSVLICGIMLRASLLFAYDDFRFEHRQHDIALLIDPFKTLSRFEYHVINSLIRTDDGFSYVDVSDLVAWHLPSHRRT